MGQHTDIIPFWNNIPAIFKYPAKTESLITIGVLSVLWLLTMIPGLIGLILFFVLIGATYKFAYTVLAHTAKGHLDPPNNMLQYNSGNIFWKQLGLWLLLGVFVFVVTRFLGITMGMISGLLVLIGLPVATMSLAIDQDVFRALNPAIWLEVIVRIGWPYLVLIVFLLLFLSTSAAIQQYIVPIFPSILGYILLNFFSMYFLVAIFYLMGYVIYQFHEELEYEIDDYHLQPLGNPAETREAEKLSEIQDMIAEGDAQAAKTKIESELRNTGPLSPLHEQYQKLCQLTGDHKALTEHGKRQITAMLELRKNKEALKLARDCFHADPNFQPATPDQILPLAEIASDWGDSKLLLKITNGFNKRYPKHKDEAPVLFLVARVLSEKMGKDEKALQILKYLQTKHSEHPLREDISAFTQVVQSLLSK